MPRPRGCRRRDSSRELLRVLLRQRKTPDTSHVQLTEVNVRPHVSGVEAQHGVECLNGLLTAVTSSEEVSEL